MVWNPVADLTILGQDMSRSHPGWEEHLGKGELTLVLKNLCFEEGFSRFSPNHIYILVEDRLNILQISGNIRYSSESKDDPSNLSVFG